MWRTRHFGSYPYETQPLLPNRTKAKTAARVAKHRAFGALRGGWCSILLASLLCACTVVDTIDPRIDLTNRQTARARDQAVLLNIVRANHNLPLNFVAFSRVSGTQSASLSLASPTFLLGPGGPVATIGKQEAVVNNTTLSTSGTTNNAFDLTVLDSKDFYNALLSPVDLPTLQFFVRQGYSRELLFWMFTDSVRIKIGDKRFEFRNYPGLYRYGRNNDKCKASLAAYRRPKVQCFDDMVDDAVISGLTAETKSVLKSSSSSDDGTSHSEGTKEKKKQSTIYGRLCFDRYLEARAKREYPDPEMQEKVLLPRRSPECGSPWNPERDQTNGGTDTLSFDAKNTPFGPVHYEVITRSTFGIYQFLGDILRNDAMNDVQIRGLSEDHEDHRILAVSTSPSLEPCFVELRFAEHEYFCVPQKGAENTKRIFSMLVQLIALKTQASDLAITPLVRVTP